EPSTVVRLGAVIRHVGEVLEDVDAEAVAAGFGGCHHRYEAEASGEFEKRFGCASGREFDVVVPPFGFADRGEDGVKDFASVPDGSTQVDGVDVLVRGGSGPPESL